MARARTTEPAATETSSELVCPECGKTFARPAALGSHRRRAHGVAGATSRGKPVNRGRTATTAAKNGGRRSGSTRKQRASAAPATAARSSLRNGTRKAPVDRDALLRMLFPNGIPAREEAIQSVNAWLVEAERLARMR